MFKPTARVLQSYGRHLHTANTYSNLEKWITSPKQLSLADSFNFERTSDLFITLPTRDGTRAPYKDPQLSTPLGYGHHLAFFHSRLPESQLRHDGTEGDFCPPEPFTRRMWAGGKITWNNDHPLMIGGHAKAVCGILSVDKKSFDSEGGKDAKVFVKQSIEISMEGNKEASVLEERAHVYLTRAAGVNAAVRQVKDLPSSVDFSFKYTPTLITLFRFSALMFNAHYIHLDQEYSQKKEGYPERLVHGPLTAMMLLETAVFNNPNIVIKSFEYRARNPVIMNKDSTINGTWKDDKTIFVWCVDNEGVVGMTGSIVVA